MISLFEDLGVVGLEAVEDFAPDGHDALKLRVPAELDAAHGGVALHDVELPAVRSFVRQSTNFCTRLEISMVPVSFF